MWRNVIIISNSKYHQKVWWIIHKRTLNIQSSVWETFNTLFIYPLTSFKWIKYRELNLQMYLIDCSNLALFRILKYISFVLLTVAYLGFNTEFKGYLTNSYLSWGRCPGRHMFVFLQLCSFWTCSVRGSHQN